MSEISIKEQRKINQKERQDKADLLELTLAKQIAFLSEYEYYTLAKKMVRAIISTLKEAEVKEKEYNQLLKNYLDVCDENEKLEQKQGVCRWLWKKGTGWFVSCDSETSYKYCQFCGRKIEFVEEIVNEKNQIPN